MMMDPMPNQQTKASQNHWLIATGCLGLIGALIVGAGEFLLQFATTGYTQPPVYDYLIGIPQWRTTWGHFLAVFAAPLYLVGYWHLFLMLKSAHRNLAFIFFLIGAYSFIVGGIWIGSRAELTMIVNLIHQTPNALELGLSTLITKYQLYSESLLTVLRIAVVVNSIIFIALTLSGKSLYKRWMALFNPAILLGFVFVCYLIIPQVGQYLLPTAMNVAHVVLFGLSLSQAICSK